MAADRIDSGPAAEAAAAPAQPPAGAGAGAAVVAGPARATGDADAQAAMRFPVDIPFIEALGVQPAVLADGRAELRLSVQPWQTNSWQVAHGGVLMSLLDVAMAQAARTTQQVAQGQWLGMATIEMKTSFVRPAQGALVATARVLHVTLTMAFCEGSVHDAAGRLCAHATGTFKFNRRPAPASAP